MRDVEQLREVLERLDGRGYKAYKELQRSYTFTDFALHVDHVQGDPFADPTRVRAVLDIDQAGLPASSYRSRERAFGTASLLARTFSELTQSARSGRGTGRSGEIRMEHPGQVVLPQTAVRVSSEGDVEARFTVGLPARGRRIDGPAAARLLLDDLPRAVGSSLVGTCHDPDTVELCAATNEDATALRAMLDGLGLIAFVADGARLPRRSGVDDRPLIESVVPFEAPASMRVDVVLPNSGSISGLGVPTGVTLIVGGGFHGKSTLLRALQAGVYNHRPGDGRHFVVSREDLVKVRAEDGRAISGVDLSPFIDGLPLGRGTKTFSTPNASGSTSQAAAITEALEAGAGTLLVDEDTSATNFMIRDRRMQELVPKSAEPITPFVDRVRALYEERNVSTVLVLGGSGDYLDVADHVIRLADYRPLDVSSDARAVAERFPTGRTSEATARLGSTPARSIDVGSVDARKGRRANHVKVPDGRTLLFGTDTIDLAAVEQLASRAQTRSIGLAMAWIGQAFSGGSPTMPELLDAVEGALLEKGLDAFDSRLPGDLAAFRRFELAAALNRLRTLRVE